MMGGDAWQFVSTLAAVALLVTLAHATGFSRTGTLADSADATEWARLTPGGFEPVETAVDGRGRAAICRNGAGEVLLLVPHGVQFVQLKPHPALVCQQEGDELVLDNCDGRGKQIALHLGDATGRWAALLAEQIGRHA